MSPRAGPGGRAASTRQSASGAQRLRAGSRCSASSCSRRQWGRGLGGAVPAQRPDGGAHRDVAVLDGGRGALMPAPAASARQWLGLVVGFAASSCSCGPISPRAARVRRAFGWGVVSVQIACAGWAIGSAYTRRHVMPGDVLGSAALQMVFGGIFMLVAGTVLGEWGSLSLNATTATSWSTSWCSGQSSDSPRTRTRSSTSTWPSCRSTRTSTRSLPWHWAPSFSASRSTCGWWWRPP